MAARNKQTNREAAGDPLSDLLDDTDMKRAAAKARPRAHQRSHRGNAEVWWIAAAASLVWAASVLAFSWSRFALPTEAGSVLDAARSRIGIADWMMIGAAIVGPLLLIWVIAWLVQRAMELRDQSRRLAKAAILLTEAAETTEMRAELLLPSRGSGGLLGGPGLNKEIERATDAMSALKAQMTAMEQAMARQAAALEDRSERGRALANRSSVAALSDGRERASDNLVVQDEFTPAAPVTPKAPPLSGGGADTSGLVVTDTGTPAVTADAKVDAVDMTLDQVPKTRVETLRAGLLAAGKAVDWTKLTDQRKAAPAKHAVAAAAAAEPVPAPAAAAAPVADMTVAAMPEDRLDPFDDLGAAPALGPAAAAGVAMTLRADRDEPAFSGGWTDAAPSGPAKTPDEPIGKQDFSFEKPNLDWKKFIRAANFPESEDDTETLDALYDVLTDTEAASLLQSAEDTLATLADLDLYMEDFVPKMSPVTSWRAHLEGKDASGLEAIDSPIEQSRIDVKLKNDPAFRKLTERFSERYMQVVKRLFKEAGDDRLVLDLADTRTGRAYLLLGKPLGRL